MSLRSRVGWRLVGREARHQDRLAVLERFGSARATAELLDGPAAFVRILLAGPAVRNRLALAADTLDELGQAADAATIRRRLAAAAPHGAGVPGTVAPAPTPQHKESAP